MLRSLSISSSLWPSSAIRMMSSANRRWFNLSPSMFIPLLSQLILRRISSSAALKTLGHYSVSLPDSSIDGEFITVFMQMDGHSCFAIHHLYEFDVFVVDTLLLKSCYHCLRFNAVITRRTYMCAYWHEINYFYMWTAFNEISIFIMILVIKRWEYNKPVRD